MADAAAQAALFGQALTAAAMHAQLTVLLFYDYNFPKLELIAPYTLHDQDWFFVFFKSSNKRMILYKGPFVNEVMLI